MNFTSMNRLSTKPDRKAVSHKQPSCVRIWYVALLWGVCGLLASPAFAQKALPLNDLSAFQDPGKTWKIVGDVNADLQEKGVLNTTKGEGILANVPTKKRTGKDLYTQLEHGDVDLELDYMMAKGSNSGIYLQGRYEIQLLDSWGITNPRAGDNGGIYERWDESQPDGQKGYEGFAPRQNVSRAPGLWQHLKISFQAPRFDAQGNKTENAKILSVELNGVTIHEDVELSGPTRGAMEDNEVAQGPFRIQGDHGAVAFKNIVITEYGKPQPELSDLQYSIYKGIFESEPDYATLEPVAEGTAEELTFTVSPLTDDVLLRYQGTLSVKTPGEYHFNMGLAGGGGLLRINNKAVVPISRNRGRGSVTLPAGEVPFELVYAKIVDWITPSFTLLTEGPGIRAYEMTTDFTTNEIPDPILVHAPETTLLRSFMDIPDGPKVVHAISVGSPKQVHYTYDLDNGMPVQIWRGDFLNTTPMWHSRGNGTSRPLGSVLGLGKPTLNIAQLSSQEQTWKIDSAQAAFQPKGYVLDANDQPVFQYEVYGTQVKDAVHAREDGQGIYRRLEVENPAGDLYARLATGKSIKAVADGLYLIDDKAYYVQLEDASVKPVIRNSEGGQELIAPLQTQLSYSILF